MRCALYLRVSDPKYQTVENQRGPLEKFRDSQGWKIGPVYVEGQSAYSPEAKRPAFRQMLKEAGVHKFDLLLFWALDRFCREGSFRTLYHLNYLAGCGVKIKSFTEPYLDTATAMGEANVALLAALAKQESVRHSERVRAGMVRAKAEGRQVGRPLRKFTHREFARLLQAGFSTVELMHHFKISRSLVYEVKRDIRNLAPDPADQQPISQVAADQTEENLAAVANVSESQIVALEQAETMVQVPDVVVSVDDWL